MSVLFETTMRPVVANRSTGIYLMELRRRVAETHSRRRKLAEPSWSLPEIELMPGSRKSRRFAQS